MTYDLGYSYTSSPDMMHTSGRYNCYMKHKDGYTITDPDYFTPEYQADSNSGRGRSWSPGYCIDHAIVRWQRSSGEPLIRVWIIGDVHHIEMTLTEAQAHCDAIKQRIDEARAEFLKTNY